MLGSRVFRRVLPFGVPLRRTAFETKRGGFFEIFTASTGGLGGSTIVISRCHSRWVLSAKACFHRPSYKIADGERISERSGSWFTRSFGAGYSDLDNMVEQLEKHRANDLARQAGLELPRSVRRSALSLKE